MSRKYIKSSKIYNWFKIIVIIIAVVLIIISTNYLFIYNNNKSFSNTSYSNDVYLNNFITGINPNKPNVVVITTGGTIMSGVKSKSEGALQTVTGKQLLESLPNIPNYANVILHEFKNIDSRDITPQDWIKLARLVNEFLSKKEITSVVIVHGTDTMEYTAFFLEYTVTSDKPVLLTGGMLTSTDLNPDGPRNLMSAIRVAADDKTPRNLVAIVFNNKIISAVSAKKMHSTNIDAFRGGNHGYVGIVDQDYVTWLNMPLKHKKFDIKNELPRVDIIPVYPGVDETFLNAALKQNTKGIIVVGYGTGNTNQAIAKALDQYFERKIPVIVDSIVPYGNSLPAYGGLGGGAYFKQKGAILGNIIRPGKARILLMLAIANNDKLESLRPYFDHIE